MQRAISVTLIAVVCVFPTLGRTQTVLAPTAPGIPFDIPYGPPVSLNQATRIAAAAAAQAGQHNWKEAIAVVDPDGELVYFERIDGTQAASGVIAQQKAATAARYRRTTKIFQDLVDHGHPSILTLPGIVASEGGIPIIVDGKLIGAIGVSGGNSAQDGMVANAGLSSAK
jgi:glc operon protein GlcG